MNETPHSDERGAQGTVRTTNGDALIWTPHPVIDSVDGGKYHALSDDEICDLRANGWTPEDVEEYWRAREERIRRSLEDPLRYGFELAFWADVRALLSRKKELYGFGGNNPGKTEIGGKLASEALIAKPGAKVLCVTLNDDYSKLQQARVYKYLPAAARGLNEKSGPRKRDVVKNINYSQKNGFTEGTFVLPTRSQCWFKTVEQYFRNPTSFEGPEYDFIWLDEPVPHPLVETLRYRAGKLAGKILHTFTAVNGYDATCASVLTGARVIKSLPMNWTWAVPDNPRATPSGGPDPRVTIPELGLDEVQVKGLPPGHMPYLMQPLNPGQGVIFLWTHWNLFQPRSEQNPAVPELFDTARGKSKRTVRMRLFGWAEKLSGCQFPAFNPNVHVIPHERIEAMLRPDGAEAPQLTSYLAGDPATARSYYLLWLGVDKLGRKFIFDESPRIGEGDWVGDDGEKGDGQALYAGRGTDFYKGYIRAREREHGVQALRRFGDPRAFATEAAARDGGADLFQLFLHGAAAEGEEDAGDLAPMNWEPAKVKRSLAAEAASGSLDMINTAFNYDAEQPISVENEPQLYISERCENLIRALLNWDPAQGDKSPWKDPIDTLRYLFGEPLYYQDPEIPEIVSGSGW
ncbi:MAG: hypothetical protein KGL39_39630 [Patescibacteria group bacterium]|nr:hypothetical protein [Patescibacteria group bacterium]